jgi:hypothetical protein
LYPDEAVPFEIVTGQVGKMILGQLYPVITNTAIEHFHHDTGIQVAYFSAPETVSAQPIFQVRQGARCFARDKIPVRVLREAGVSAEKAGKKQ